MSLLILYASTLTQQIETIATTTTVADVKSTSFLVDASFFTLMTLNVVQHHSLFYKITFIPNNKNGGKKRNCKQIRAVSMVIVSQPKN